MNPNDPIPALDQVTVEFLTNLFQESIVLMQANFDSRISEIEKNIESIEKQIATLVVGYGEQAVFMEALIGQLVFASDEERKNFNNNLASARKEMLEVMSNASETLLARDNQGLASAITDVVEEQSSSSN
jgi:septation ring formation regulator EzrA